MRRVFGSLGLALVMVSACTGVPGTSRVANRGTPTANKTPAPKVSTTATPSVAPSPKGPMVTLAGTLKIDAAYVIANNGGTLVSNNGGSVLQIKSGIISDNGLGLISDNGLGLISDNGLGYRIQQAAATKLAVGTVLPAAGMPLVAINLLDGKVLSEVVKSDAKGNFTISVPKSAVGNTLVRARVPESQDVRMNYDVVTQSDVAQTAVDEDTAAYSRFLRKVWAGKVEELILRGMDALGPGSSFKGIADTNPIVGAVLKDIIQQIEAAKLKDLPEAQRKAVAQRISDILIYYVDLETAQLDATFWEGPPEPAVAAMMEMMKQFREAATQKMVADPAFFEKQPYIVKANEVAATDKTPPVEIKKPADLNDYVVNHIFLVLVGDRGTMLKEVAASIGMDTSITFRFHAAAVGILNTVGFTLFTNADAKKAISEAIKAASPTKRP